MMEQRDAVSNETEYRADSRLIFYRLEQLERQAHDMLLFKAAQDELTAKTKRDVDEAHNKLRLIVARERYKAWTAIAGAVTAAVAAVAAWMKRI